MLVRVVALCLCYVYVCVVVSEWVGGKMRAAPSGTASSWRLPSAHCLFGCCASQSVDHDRRGPALAASP